MSTHIETTKRYYVSQARFDLILTWSVTSQDPSSVVIPISRQHIPQHTYTSTTRKRIYTNIIKSSSHPKPASEQGLTVAARSSSFQRLIQRTRGMRGRHTPRQKFSVDGVKNGVEGTGVEATRDAGICSVDVSRGCYATNKTVMLSVSRAFFTRSYPPMCDNQSIKRFPRMETARIHAKFQEQMEEQPCSISSMHHYLVSRASVVI